MSKFCCLKSIVSKNIVRFVVTKKNVKHDSIVEKINGNGGVGNDCHVKKKP